MNSQLWKMSAEFPVKRGKKKMSPELRIGLRKGQKIRKKERSPFGAELPPLLAILQNAGI